MKGRVEGYIIQPFALTELETRWQTADERQRFWRFVVIRIGVAGAAALATLVMTGLAEWHTALLTLVSLVVLPLSRVLLDRHWYLYAYAAEWETLANLFFVVISGITIAVTGVTLTYSLFRLPLSQDYLTAFFLTLSATAFVLRGGTYVTRGILDKAGVIPRYGQRVDTVEYNRGRIIGNVERLLLLLVAVFGSYEALGFLVAAKGLIRAREFEDRAFAEYFIVGSLTSVLVALLVGLALRYALLHLGVLS